MSELFNPPPITRCTEMEAIIVEAILKDHTGRIEHELEFLRRRLVGRRATRRPLWRRILAAFGL